MKILVLMSFVCLPLFVCAQKTGNQQSVDSLIDSLTKAIARNKNDTNEVLQIYKLAIAYEKKNDPDKKMQYAKQGLLLSEKLKYKKGLARFHFLIGFANLRSDDLSSALNNFYSVLRLKNEISKNGEANCYLNIGHIYSSMKDYPEAMKNYRMCLKISSEINDKSLVAFSLQNIATIYNFEGNYVEALKNAVQGLKIFEEINDTFGIATAYEILGATYHYREDFAAARKNYFAAQKIFEKLGSDYRLANVLEQIAALFMDQGKFSEAEHYFNKAILLGKKVGSLSIVENAQDVLTQTYVQAGNYKKAFETYKAYIATRDSIFNGENSKKIVRAQMQFDFDKKEAAAALEQEKRDGRVKIKLQQKNILIYGTLCASIVLLAISGLIVRQYKLKGAHQKIELEQKQLRAQMNPHFIFNCLNSIQQFIITNDVKNANKYLTGFAMLMRQTLENSKAGTITLQKELAYIANYLSLESIRFKEDFTYEINCANDISSVSIEIPAMIIQPFIENAIRHGLCYLEDRKGRLLINFYLKENCLFCEIDDNGIGREKSHQLKMNSETIYESHGMELTRLRLALVSKDKNADYEIRITDKKNVLNEPEGTTVTIKFPLTA